MPEPAGVALVPDKGPHLIHLRLRFPCAFHVPGYLGGVQRAQHSGVHRLQHRFFLLEFTQHGIGTDMQGSRRIAHPTGIETHVDDHVLDLRQAPAIAIVEQKTALGTQGVLAEVALGSSSRFAAFDDLVTLAMRAADGDERHGPFLPKRGYEDEAQCDINPSLSPLLKHYRLMQAQRGLGRVTGDFPCPPLYQLFLENALVSEAGHGLTEYWDRLRPQLVELTIFALTLLGPSGGVATNLRWASATRADRKDSALCACPRERRDNSSTNA